jgi:hypothetical protein
LIPIKVLERLPLGDLFYFEVKVAARRGLTNGEWYKPGDAISNGFNLDGVNKEMDPLGFAKTVVHMIIGERRGEQVPRPDFIMGPFAPKEKERHGNWLIGDFALSSVGFYRKYVKPAKQLTQAIAMAEYSKKYTMLPVVSMVGMREGTTGSVRFAGSFKALEKKVEMEFLAKWGVIGVVTTVFGGR